MDSVNRKPIKSTHGKLLLHQELQNYDELLNAKVHA